jgi:CRISPR-associated protein Csh1
LNFDESYKNIFDLERAFRVFLNKEFNISYFESKYDSPYERESIDSIFDFIYKAKSEAISLKSFQKLALNSIKDSIKKNQDISKDIDILKKLNLYLNLNQYFKGENLANLVIEHIKTLQDILNVTEKNNFDSEKSIDNDELFAFASGQLIRYLVNQNQSANNSHSLLSAYISKHNIKELKRIIVQNIEKYSHSLQFNKRFEKLSSEVLGYEIDGDLKELLAILMSGYFATNIIYTKSNKGENNEK